MTKCGEEWDDTTGVAHTDHRYESLVASIDCSLERLGAIEVLQLHRAKAETLRSAGVQRAIDHARAAGVPVIGASVSDLTSARVAVEELGLRLLQFPFSADNTYMEEAFAMARDVACTVVVNRPLGMGRLAYREASNPSADPACITEAFRFVLARQFDGVVLSGTASPEHLAMNVGCFRSALASTRTSRPGVARG